MTELERSILIGMVIGDGHITKDGVFKVWHSTKQRQYVEHKRKIVSKILSRKINTNECTSQHYTGKEYYTCGFSISAAFFKELRNMFYPQGIKQLTEDILLSLTEESLAIWFMDDGVTGCRIHKERGKTEPSSFYLELGTYCDYKQAELIQKYFNTIWDIYPKIRNSLNKTNKEPKYNINFNTKESKKFYGLIKDHIIPEMQYKLRYCE